MKKVMNSMLSIAIAAMVVFPSSAALQRQQAECKNNECEGFKVGMYRIKDTLTMNFLMDKQKDRGVMLRLRDNAGKVIYQEYVGKAISRFGKKFNFSQVEDGHYTLEISDQTERIVKNIFLTSREVSEVEGRMVTMK